MKRPDFEKDAWRIASAIPDLLAALEEAVNAANYGADLSSIAYSARQALIKAGYTFES